MPVLDNLRREAFVHAYIRGFKHGISLTEAARQAGYRDGPGIRAQASRLLTQRDVKERIVEVLKPEVRKTLKNVRALLLDLQEAADEARAAGQHAVFIGARAKQAELMIKANDVSPDAFADVHNVQQIRSKIEAEYGAEALAQVEAIVAALRGPTEAHPILIEGQVVDNVDDAS